MEAREKARELVAKFARIDGYNDSIDLSTCKDEKLMAIIAVDEIINNNEYLSKNQYHTIDNTYWQKVKNEIENL